MEIKELLKARRLEKNLTLDEVAHMVGVSAPTISRWESGDIANMRRDKIVKLAQALDISPAVIMGLDNEESDNTKNTSRKGVIFMTIGERIKNVRTKLGISQVAFADKIGVSKQTLYKYENNIITNIPSDKIEAIAKFSGYSPSYFMGWENAENNARDYMIHSLTSDESWFVEHYRSSDEQTKEMVKRLLSYTDVTDNHNHS